MESSLESSPSSPRDPHDPSPLPAALAVALHLAFLGNAGGAMAQTTTPSLHAPTQLQSVTVLGNYENGVGTSDAASQGSVTSKLIESRPTLRPAEVLEFVPGVIVSQHSGDGKANQYYLRGFNLDHGTDFATFVDGMPVNMPTHAHGQGYSDLNWLIPEIVDRIDYKKGPYFADKGDFSSAGAAHISLFGDLPKGIASLTVGKHEYARALLTKSIPLGDGRLLYAVEAAHNNGPWDSPERFHRLNGVLRYSFGGASSRSSITAMAYSAGWDSTDQNPQRAVASRLIDRLGAIDPSDGGQTSRFSLSYNTERIYSDGTLKLNAYAIQSRLDLFSDFTYNLDNPDPQSPVISGSGRVAASTRQSPAWTTRRPSVPRFGTTGWTLSVSTAPSRAAGRRRRRTPACGKPASASTPKTRRNGCPGSGASKACASTASISTSRAPLPRTVAGKAPT